MKKLDNRRIVVVTRKHAEEIWAAAEVPGWLKVHLAISLSANKIGEAEVSIETMANLTGLHRSTVMLNVRELETRGMITVARNENRRGNFYIVNGRAQDATVPEAGNGRAHDATIRETKNGRIGNAERSHEAAATVGLETRNGRAISMRPIQHRTALEEQHNAHARDAILKVDFASERHMTPRKRKCPHITVADLRDDNRLLDVFDTAVGNGVIGNSDADLLFFFAAAERAMRVGNDPCKLFSSIVNQQQRDCIVNSDEDAAQLRLRSHLHGESPLKSDWRDEYRDEAALA